MSLFNIFTTNNAGAGIRGFRDTQSTSLNTTTEKSTTGHIDHMTDHWSTIKQSRLAIF